LSSELKRLDALRVDAVVQLVGKLDHRRDALDGDRFRLGADLELEVGLDDAIGRHQRFARDALEPLQLGGHVVEADRQFGEPESAGRVGDRGAREPGFLAHRADRHPGQHAAGRIGHRAGDVTGSALRRSRGGAEQCDGREDDTDTAT
jgi:hypothetical protein